VSKEAVTGMTHTPHFTYFVSVAIALFLLTLSIPIFAKTTSESSEEFWFDGNRKRVIQRVEREFALYSQKELLESEIDLRQESGSDQSITILNRNDFFAHAQSIDTIDPGDLQTRGGHSVYRQATESKEGLLFSTGEIIVHFVSNTSPEQAEAWGHSQDLTFLKPLMGKSAYLFQCKSDLICVEQANLAFYDTEVQYAYPNWLKTRDLRHLESTLTNDTLFSSLWHLRNTGLSWGIPGNDINAVEAWSLNHGSPETIIGIVDDGVEIAHEDLSGNNILTLNWDFLGNDPNPTGGSHGTAVAGLAAAQGGNALGVSGAAPHAGLAAIRLIGANTDTNEAVALNHEYNTIDIYSNSWGPLDNGALDGPSPLTMAAIVEGVTNGRGGKGNIYVWAGGNGKTLHDNSNYDGYANLPYVIAVAATNSEGTQAYYSEPGANIWVNAPGGDYSGWLTTTDKPGPFGYSGTDYTHKFGGTSASTPLVSGTVALMLDQNPELSWRDVKYILAKTATKNDPLDTDWVQNGAGYWVNHKYGFGRINAYAALEQAKTHNNLPPLKSLEATTTPERSIPDNNPTGITSQITISDDIGIEFVQITVDSDHPYWGDMSIELTSPSGNRSILAERHHSSGAQLDGGWTFGTVRNYGESAKGIWTLHITDTAAQDSGNLKQWRIKILGYTQGTNPPALAVPTLSNTALLLMVLLMLSLLYTFRLNFSPHIQSNTRE
jgi:kexin